ncbi:MAG TPA: rhodanese-like domain-containing protein [Thauera sp.]|nr:rhodanese-like domain-containing protein [Thauera sp.]
MSMQMNFVYRYLMICTLLGAAAHAQAAASLRNEIQLKLALRTSPPCCVVDARAEAQRKTRAIADALIFREGLKIKPTATVVVVADTDDRALAVARTIASAHPGKSVFAVEGGVSAWESVVGAITAELPGGRATEFVIPKNTCEQGPALQQLRTGPK